MVRRVRKAGCWSRLLCLAVHREPSGHVADCDHHPAYPPRVSDGASQPLTRRNCCPPAAGTVACLLTWLRLQLVFRSFAAWVTLLAYSGSCGQGEFEVGEVAGAGAVQGMAVPPGIQPDQVERDGAVHVLKVGLGQAAVAGAT